MFQRMQVIGYLGKAPEMRYFPDGTAVTNFSVATSRKWTDRASGLEQEETTWFRVSVFGRQAEACNQYLSKGSMVLVEGRMKADPATGGPKLWTRNDGTVGASFEISADLVRFLNTPVGKSAEAGIGDDETAVLEDDQIPF